MAPPFMNAHGLVTKILDKVITASQPERFTQDFLASKLGFDSASARPIIPLLKRMTLLASDGSPTQLYAKFRNPEERGKAMAQAIRTGYKDVFERNEYAHALTKDKFKNLIVEVTGLESSDQTVNAIVGTFFNLKNYANFDENSANGDEKKSSVTLLPRDELPTPSSPPPTTSSTGFNLSYTINLNLPETPDVEVFNAIFRSLKENLLKA